MNSYNTRKILKEEEKKMKRQLRYFGFIATMVLVITGIFTLPGNLIIGHASGSSYEAESSGNSLYGSAKVVSCSACSGGNKIGNLGGTTNSGAMTFNNINVGTSGSYTLIFYYIDGDTSGGRT